MYWDNKFALARPKNADFEEQQKRICNHRVTLGVSKNIGKYAVFLPSLLEAKMRGPLLHHHRQPTTAACLSCIYEPDTEEFARESHIAEHLGVSLEEVRTERISMPAALVIAARYTGITANDIEGTAYDSFFKRMCSEGQLRSTADKRVVAPFAFVSVLAGTLLALEIVRRLGTAAHDRNFNYWRVSPWHPPMRRRRIQRPRQPGCSFCSDRILAKVNGSLW